ncbi:MAG TPA: acyl carrier protein [Kofleriaceae bacterium]|nr:acyl carrier protein [Kofleriaceae bacterium]
MTQDALKRRLREFVAKNFYLAEPGSFDDASSFLDRGVIDSTGVLELVTFVEDEYGITVADEEIVPANFDTVNALAGFVAQKTA